MSVPDHRLSRLGKLELMTKGITLIDPNLGKERAALLDDVHAARTRPTLAALDKATLRVRAHASTALRSLRPSPSTRQGNTIDWDDLRHVESETEAVSRKLSEYPEEERRGGAALLALADDLCSQWRQGLIAHGGLGDQENDPKRERTIMEIGQAADDAKQALELAKRTLVGLNPALAMWRSGADQTPVSNGQASAFDPTDVIPLRSRAQGRSHADRIQDLRTLNDALGRVVPEGGPEDERVALGVECNAMALDLETKDIPLSRIADAEMNARALLMGALRACIHSPLAANPPHGAGDLDTVPGRLFVLRAKAESLGFDEGIGVLEGTNLAAYAWNAAEGPHPDARTLEAAAERFTQLTEAHLEATERRLQAERQNASLPSVIDTLTAINHEEAQTITRYLPVHQGEDGHPHKFNMQRSREEADAYADAFRLEENDSTGRRPEVRIMRITYMPQSIETLEVLPADPEPEYGPAGP